MVGERPYTFYLAKQAYDEAGKPIEGKYIQPDGSISSTETRYATGKVLFQRLTSDSIHN